MRVSTVIRLAVACLLYAGGARAAEPVKELDVDKAFPVLNGEAAELNLEAGPIVFTKLLLRNPPSEEEIREATNDNAHPKPVVYITNNGSSKARILITVSLEDGQGKVFLKCTKTAKVDAGEKDDSANLCWIENMKVADWPKVKLAHLVAHVSPME